MKFELVVIWSVILFSSCLKHGSVFKGVDEEELKKPLYNALYFVDMLKDSPQKGGFEKKSELNLKYSF